MTTELLERNPVVQDQAKLFNSSLGGNTRRAIDLHEGEKVDAGDGGAAFNGRGIRG
jgi:hypothetical protein